MWKMQHCGHSRTLNAFWSSMSATSDMIGWPSALDGHCSQECRDIVPRSGKSNAELLEVRCRDSTSDLDVGNIMVSMLEYPVLISQPSIGEHSLRLSRTFSTALAGWRRSGPFRGCGTRHIRTEALAWLPGYLETEVGPRMRPYCRLVMPEITRLFHSQARWETSVSKQRMVKAAACRGPTPKSTFLTGQASHLFFSSHTLGTFGRYYEGGLS